MASLPNMPDQQFSRIGEQLKPVVRSDERTRPPAVLNTTDGSAGSYFPGTLLRCKSGLLPATRFIHAAGSDKFHDMLEFAWIEPGPVFPTNIDDYP